MLPGETQRATPVGRVVLILALLWFAWRAGLGLTALAGEVQSHDGDWLARVLGNSEEQRIEWTLGQHDRRLGLAQGYHRALYRALIDHVPLATTVLLDVRQERSKVRVMATLGPLVFPRVARMADGKGTPDMRGIEQVLSFGEASRAAWEVNFAPLLQGADWTLWQKKEVEHGPR